MRPSGRMLTMRRLAGASARMRRPVQVVLGQGLQSVTNLITSVMLGRLASSGELGRFVLATSLLLLLLSLGDTLVLTPFTYAVVRRRLPAARAALSGSCLLAALLLGLVAVACVGLCAGLFPGLGLPGLPLSLVLVACTLREACRRWGYVLGTVGRVLASDALAGIGQVVLLTGLAACGMLGAAGALWAMGLASLVGTLPLASQLRGRVSLRRRWLLPSWAAFLRYGAWLVAGGACQILAVQSYSWFLFFAADVRATGAFAACLTISNLPGPLLVGVTNFARPRAMAVFRDRGSDALAQQTVRLGLLVGAPVAAFVALVVLGGGSLLQAVYGAAFAWASPELSVASLALLCVTAAAPMQLAMLAMGQPRSNLVFGAVPLLMAYALGLPLTLRLGLRGALLGYAAGAFAATCVLLAMLLRQFARQRRQVGRGTKAVPG